MKKSIFAIVLLLLSGCSDSQSVFHLYEQKKSKEVNIQNEKEEVVLPKVTVHSAIGNSHGYVVSVDKHKKYIVTVASVVSTHPCALVETSTGQIVEGEIIGINKEQNIAIVSIKLTAPIEAFSLSDHDEEIDVAEVSEAMINDEQQFVAMTSIMKEGDHFVTSNVLSSDIQNLLANALEAPLSVNERIQLKKDFADFPEVTVASNNAIEHYEKDTFTYNPDELLLFINEFQQALNRYFITKDESEFLPYIASDDLQMTIKQLATDHAGSTQFGSVTSITSSKQDFQYIIEGKTTLTVDGEVGEFIVTVKCLRMNGEWKVISVNYK